MTLTRIVTFMIVFGCAAGTASAQAAAQAAPPPAQTADAKAAAARDAAARAEALAVRAPGVDVHALSAEAAMLRAGAAAMADEAMALRADVAPMMAGAMALAAWDYAPEFQEAAWGRGAGSLEARLYAEGRAALDKAQWDRAIGLYTEVAAFRGERADAALYWRAFAQDRQGLRADALATLAALSRDYPKSRYLAQAKVLEAEVRQNAGQPVRPQDQADEDLKLFALNALQHSDPAQAVPMLDKLLRGSASPRLKERALFVLAQSDAPQAREIMAGIARGNSTPGLQGRAITYLGQLGGAESRALLADVYASTSDVAVKRGILRSFMVAGEKGRLVTAAQSEQNPELRAEAIRQLGVMNAHDELWQLYQRETSVDHKRQMIRAMFVGGNATRMTELARTEKTPELRREAIRNLGLMGAKGTVDALVSIYGSETDADVKRAVISALGTGDHAEALVGLARKEQDSALRADIVRRLSTMTRESKVAADYMLEILGGEVKKEERVKGKG